MAELVLKDGDRVQLKLESRPELKTTMPAPPDVRKAPQGDPVASAVAGAVHGAVLMMSFASFAFLIFGNSEHTELQEAFPLGISQQLLSAALTIGILTFTGFFPFTMGGPTPPAALLVAEVVRVAADNVTDPENLVSTAMLAIMLVTLFMALFLILLSVTKTAGYAQQLPVPVLTGFLGGVGCLLMRGAIGILMSLKLKWVLIPKDFDAVKNLDGVLTALHLLLGLCVALLLIKGIPFIRKRNSQKKIDIAILPTMFLCPLVVFFVAAAAGGNDFSKSGNLRLGTPSWLLPQADVKPFWNLWIESYDVGKWEFDAILAALPQILLSAILCVMAGMINMAGIEANAPQETGLDLNKEFMSLGRAQLVTGLFAGHPGHHVAAFTLPMKKDGGSRKSAPWTAVFLWTVCFLSSAPIDAFVPRFFLGGCFLALGFNLARMFLWDNRKQMDLPSKVISYLTTFVAVMLDLNWASAVGFVLVALNFVRLSMNMQVIRAVERVDVRRSMKSRPLQEVSLLKNFGHRIMAMYLEGYLFWGTVDEINAAFESIVDGTDDDPSIIYVDMRFVQGIELSVVNALRKLKRIAGSVGIDLIVCNIPSASKIGPQLHGALAGLPFTSEKDLDDLLEESEDKLIQEHRVCTLTVGEPETTFKGERNLALVKFAAKNFAASVDSFVLKRVYDAWLGWSKRRRGALRSRRSPEKQNSLVELASLSSSAYAIIWELLDDGELCVNMTHNPAWRAVNLVRAAVQRQEKVNTFVTGSTKFFVDMSSDDDSIAGLPEDEVPKASPLRACLDQQKALCVHVNAVPDTAFPRKKLAQKFGIHRIFFIPMGTYVIELGGLEPPQSDGKTELQPGVTAVDYFPAELVDPDTAGIHWEKLTAVTGGKLKETPDKQNMAKEVPHPNIVVFPDDHMKPPKPEQSEAKVVRPIAGGRLSPNLLLSIATLGRHQTLGLGELLVGPRKVKGCEQTSEAIAEDIFIVIDGCLGTFYVADDADQTTTLLLKSPAGALVGVEDVWAKQPRSRLLKCLSEEAQVVALSRSIVSKIKDCDSPFVAPASGEELYNYMTGEVALSMLSMR